MRLLFMKLFFICILTTFSAIVNGQISIRNLSLTDSTLPYLYIGADNTIEIDWEKQNPSDHLISIHGGGGSISAVGENKFIVRVNTVTDDCSIRISNKKGKTILNKAYKVRVIENIMVSLDGLRDTTVSKSRILKNPLLTLTSRDCFYQFNIAIVSFEISVDIKDQIAVAPALGNYLTEKQIDLIKNANEDGLLTIDNIRALGADGRSRKLPSIAIYIKKEAL